MTIMEELEEIEDLLKEIEKGLEEELVLPFRNQAEEDLETEAMKLQSEEDKQH